MIIISMEKDAKRDGFVNILNGDVAKLRITQWSYIVTDRITDLCFDQGQGAFDIGSKVLLIGRGSAEYLTLTSKELTWDLLRTAGNETACKLFFFQGFPFRKRMGRRTDADNRSFYKFFKS